MAICYSPSKLIQPLTPDILDEDPWPCPGMPCLLLCAHTHQYCPALPFTEHLLCTSLCDRWNRNTDGDARVQASKKVCTPLKHSTYIVLVPQLFVFSGSITVGERENSIFSLHEMDFCFRHTSLFHQYYWNKLIYCVGEYEWYQKLIFIKSLGCQMYSKDFGHLILLTTLIWVPSETPLHRWEHEASWG